jgi:transcription antitermination protein NusB
MSPRRQGRILAMQSLYEWDTARHSPLDALAERAQEEREILFEATIAKMHAVDDFAPEIPILRSLAQESNARQRQSMLQHVRSEASDEAIRAWLRALIHNDGELERSIVFARELIGQVLEHLAEIDARLAAAAPRRPLEQMARVEKAILRLAISEILLNNGVPARAAINEAVELAKTYGGENSGRFVNGVLATVFSQPVLPAEPSVHFESEEPQAMSTSPHWDLLKQTIVEQLNVDPEKVVPDASFTDDLRADSLDRVELIMALEERFHVKVPDEAAQNIRTVGDALSYIDEHAQ